MRGNLAAGGKGVAQPLTQADRTIARAIGQQLAPRGLLLIGLDIIGNNPQEFGEFIKKDIVKWAKVVKDSGAKAD